MLSCNQLEKILDDLSITYSLIEPKYDTNRTKAIGYKFHENLTLFVKGTLKNKDEEIEKKGRLVLHPLILIEIEQLTELKGVYLVEKRTQSNSYKFGNFPRYLLPIKSLKEPYGTSLDFEERV